jgi:hypothetical protein
MPDFKLPLSGDVAQTINPWTILFNPAGSQIGLFNINLGTSALPATEADVLSDVASYGRQLGRIGDALVVLLRHFKPDEILTEQERHAIRDLKTMLNGIADVRERHASKIPLRP